MSDTTYFFGKPVHASHVPIAVESGLREISITIFGNALVIGSVSSIGIELSLAEARRLAMDLVHRVSELRKTPEKRAVAEELDRAAS